LSVVRCRSPTTMDYGQLTPMRIVRKEPGFV
jgi:hypothetical protein